MISSLSLISAKIVVQVSRDPSREPIIDHFDIEFRFLLSSSVMKRQKQEELFWRVADPRSPVFRHYLSLQQIKDMYGANPSDISLLRRWISKRLVTSQPDSAIRLSPAADYLLCRLTALEAYHFFPHQVIPFSLSLSLSQVLQSHKRRSGMCGSTAEPSAGITGKRESSGYGCSRSCCSNHP